MLVSMKTAKQACNRQGVAEFPLTSLLTERDVANILNLSVATIRRRRLLRKPPEPVKIGASVRYRPQEIDQFIKGAAGFDAERSR